MTTTPPPAIPAGLFVETIGALFLANTFSFLFLGVVLTKAFEYFSRFHNDRYFIQIAVVCVVIGSMIESICYFIWGYNWGAIHYGDPSIMAIVPTVFSISLVNVGIVTFVNQHFFCWRLYHVGGKSFILPGIISFLSFYQLGFILWLVPKVARNNSFLGLKNMIFPASYSWLVAAATGDVLITLGMVWYLAIKTKGVRAPVTPGLNRNLLQAIAIKTVQFNALSLVTQGLEFILFLTNTGLYFSLFTASLCKVYAFSLLLSLTSRGIETSYDNDPTMSMLTTLGGGGRSRNTNIPISVTNNGSSMTKSGLHNPTGTTSSGIVITTRKDIKVDNNEDDWQDNSMVGGYPVNVLLVADPDENSNQTKYNNERDVEMNALY